jgi:DNA-directed RNA polymerase specialized sigma24 family protein
MATEECERWTNTTGWPSGSRSTGHLRAVAYRVLGSASEADDAVQEAWLRFSRSGADGVENLGGWLTTIVARVSLNMLQIRVVFDFIIVGGKIAAIEMIADPEYLAQLDVVPLTARAASQRR